MADYYNNMYHTFTFRDEEMAGVIKIVRTHIQTYIPEIEMDDPDYINDYSPEGGKDWKECEHIQLRGNTLYLDSADSEFFDITYCTDLVQILVDREFLPDGTIITWGYTCSRPMLDQYGGGAECIKRNQKSRLCVT